MIEQASSPNRTRKPSEHSGPIDNSQDVCVVENITLALALEFGLAWKIDPAFFVSYLCGLDDRAIKGCFKEGRQPGDSLAIMPETNSKFTTVPAMIDFGKLGGSEILAPYDEELTSIRHEDWSDRGCYLGHTNLSFWRVNDKLSTFRDFGDRRKRMLIVSYSIHSSRSTQRLSTAVLARRGPRLPLPDRHQTCFC